MYTVKNSQHLKFRFCNDSLLSLSMYVILLSVSLYRQVVHQKPSIHVKYIVIKRFTNGIKMEKFLCNDLIYLVAHLSLLKYWTTLVNLEDSKIR